jgi:signal transduction histidine kinase
VRALRWNLQAVLPYGLAVAAFGALLGASHLARTLWGVTFDPTTLIILTMIGSAWYGGLGPGLLVAVLFEVTLQYFAWPPRDPTRFAIITANRAVLFGGVVVFASARRAAERRLAASLAAARAARAEAEAANRLKDEFLSVVSHELRTPLNAILGWAAMLTKHEGDAATQRHGLETIERNARAQARVVDDLLSASGLLAGRLRIVPQRVSLGRVVQDAIDTLRPEIGAHSVQVRATVDENTNVFGDAARLRHVIDQLLGNAIKFTPAGGAIDVSVARLQDRVTLTVRDEGIGITQAFLPHVFDKFRQADASYTRQHGGLGLGLAIVRELVEMHGGSVAAQSDGPGRGSVFTVHLPAAEAARVGVEESKVS